MIVCWINIVKFGTKLKKTLSINFQSIHVLEMPSIRTTRLVVHRSNTCKFLLVSSLFFCHAVFAVHSSDSHLVVSFFVWDNQGKVFIDQSWCGISYPIFSVYDILSTLLANLTPASSAPMQSSIVFEYINRQ